MKYVRGLRARYRYVKKRTKMWVAYLFAKWTGREYYLTENGIRLYFFAPYHHLMARATWKSGVEPEFMGIWKLYATRSSRIYDIGGFNGVFGLTAAKMNPLASVVIFEPDPINQAHIKKNIELNELTNCTLEPVAISDFNGKSSFSFDGTTYSMVGKGSETIQCRTLSSYPAADLIKIDAGDSEASVILGARDVLKETQPLILMQTHEHELKHAEMSDTLKKLGYSAILFRLLPQGKHIVWDPASLR